MPEAATPEILLEARQLSVSIGPRSLCQGLDLQLAAGDCLAILGRNGAGKSTLLSTLAGLRPAAAGQLAFAGQPLAHCTPKQLATLRGWLAQTHQDAFATTVLETALTGRHPHLGRWGWESARDLDIVRAALAEVGLAALASRQVHSLSGGERQRLAIATLLAQQTRLCLLDEPLAHLDLNHQMAVLALFSRRCREQQHACVMVLHDPSLAARYCSHVLMLYDNGKHRLGRCTELLTAEQLSALYAYPLMALDVPVPEQPHWFIPA